MAALLGQLAVRLAPTPLATGKALGCARQARSPATLRCHSGAQLMPTIAGRLVHTVRCVRHQSPY